MMTKRDEKEMLTRASVCADISAGRTGDDSCIEACREGLRVFEGLPSPDSVSIRRGARLYHLYAAALESQGNLAGAFQMYRRSLRWRPSSVETWDCLSGVAHRLYRQTGDTFYQSCGDKAAVNANELRNNPVRAPLIAAEARIGTTLPRCAEGF